MKVTLLALFFLILSSCGQTDSESKTSNTESSKTIVKVNKGSTMGSSQSEWYLRRYEFHTSPSSTHPEISISIRENKNDSSLSMSIYHEVPVLFESVLLKISECVPTIEEHFDLSRLTSINLRQPIYYLDLSTEWSTAYEKEFRREYAKYDERRKVLESTNLTAKLNTILSPFRKEIRFYGIEKFHLLDKKYYTEYLRSPTDPDSFKYFPKPDFSKYPEFVINGLSFSIQLK